MNWVLQRYHSLDAAEIQRAIYFFASMRYAILTPAAVKTSKQLQQKLARLEVETLRPNFKAIKPFMIIFPLCCS